MIRLRIVGCVLPLLAAVAGCSGPLAGVRPSEPASGDTPQTSAAETPGWGLDVAPPPRELVFLEVTPAAARELRGHVAELKLRRGWVRYTMVQGGCTGLLRKLDLDPEPPTDQDFEFVANGVPCLILKSQRHIAQGTQIDFGTKDGQRGFIITNPHATERTKDAITKWIMSEFDKRNPTFQRPTESAANDE